MWIAAPTKPGGRPSSNADRRAATAQGRIVGIHEHAWAPFGASESHLRCAYRHPDIALPATADRPAEAALKSPGMTEPLPLADSAPSLVEALAAETGGRGEIAAACSRRRRPACRAARLRGHCGPAQARPRADAPACGREPGSLHRCDCNSLDRGAPSCSTSANRPASMREPCACESRNSARLARQSRATCMSMPQTARCLEMSKRAMLPEVARSTSPKRDVLQVLGFTAARGDVRVA